MKKIFSLSVIVFLIITFSIVNAQSDYSHILKSYPKWTTNFEKTSINFKEIQSGGPPKDGIAAIVHPKFVNIEKAEDWYDEKEPVIALLLNGEVKAYPLQILLWHEIVNDIIGGVPVVVTFCPLCYSSIVFDRHTKGMINTFGVSGLLRNSDLIMYDQITESFWQQFTGDAIVGDMLGTQLKIYPSQLISFEQFAEEYPEGKVLSRETGYRRMYGRNPYRGYDDEDQKPFLYSGPKDNRLPPNSKVIGVKQFKTVKAYPYSITEKKKVINDSIDDKPIVIFHLEGALSALDASYTNDSKEVGTTGVFSRNIDNKTLTFEFKENVGVVDNETGSVWSFSGKSVSGKLKGKKLKPLLFGDYFAFAWIAFNPETLIFTEK